MSLSDIESKMNLFQIPKQSQPACLKLLHDVGIILYYKEPKLANLVIVHPSYLVDIMVFFHSFFLSFFLSFILSFFHSFILSFIHSFILSFFHSFILSFFFSFILSIILSFIHSSYLPNLAEWGSGIQALLDNLKNMTS